MRGRGQPVGGSIVERGTDLRGVELHAVQVTGDATVRREYEDHRGVHVLFGARIPRIAKPECGCDRVDTRAGAEQVVPAVRAIATAELGEQRRLLARGFVTGFARVEADEHELVVAARLT